MCDEKAALIQKVDELACTLTQVRVELQTRSEQLQESNARYQTRVAEITGKYQQDLAVLQERNLALQRVIDLLETALKREETALQVLREEHSAHLQELDAAHAARAKEQDKNAQQLISELTDSRNRIKSSEDFVQQREAELRDLRNQLAVAQLPSPETEAELRDLRAQLTALEAADMRNTLRAKTIESRYRTGDLNEEEKTFINSLIRTSQAIHERELVASRNELRRRDNLLKEMRAKVHMLESTLARHLNAPTTKPALPMAGNHPSLIDPSAWMSSGQSSSPPRPLDGDERPSVDVAAQEPAVSVANLIDTHEAAAPHRAGAAHDIAAGISARSSDALAHAPKHMPTVADVPPSHPAKPKFSRLATDCSDEILDFDDEHKGRKTSPPTSLHKRNKPSSPHEEADVHNLTRPLKRVRTTTARKTETADRNASGGTVVKKLKVYGLITIHWEVIL
ncbi:hypothetical protein BN946_scf184908.g22 [Trametes cinnabarina]|uniref:Uncharacterized protein n=1 Tax=Pycnoporus cinnabarinus TaxID=5643 RepID=A0A060SAA0_PYCCI|nr:hypothetical protein BN946_scf184908.g22 [Trametes cinnabarina]